MVLKAKSLGLIGGTEVAIDSTKLNAFEKAKPKSKIVDDGVPPTCILWITLIVNNNFNCVIP